ncbi:MAG: VWA domain-containing protein [Vicinamibacterales bacterium]
MVRATLAFALFSASVALVGDQQPFRTRAQTVAIYATVRDSDGRLVGDLTRDDFEVFDNGKRQNLTVFESSVQPISVVMLLDRSASMRMNFRLVEVAAGEFVKALLPADKARIGSFASRIQLDPRDFTSDRGELLTILRSELQPAGPTPLWNAVSVGVTALRHQEGRRVILVFTDGVDSPMGGRTVGYSDAARAAQAENVMVYAIGLARERFLRGSGGFGGTVRAGPGATGRPDRVIEKPDAGLPRIAAESGGGYFELIRGADLPSTFAKVADELHRQYALGFEPSKLDGKNHRLEVKVKRPDLTVRARRGYLAEKPSEQ